MSVPFLYRELRSAISPVSKRNFESTDAPQPIMVDRSELVLRMGRASIATGVFVLVVVVLAIHVCVKAYQARDYHYGIPSAASLLATLVHPVFGCVALWCTGISDYTSE